MGKGTAGAVRARRAEVAYRALPAFVMKSRRAAILAVFLADVFAYTGASSPLATKNYRGQTGMYFSTEPVRC
jgi:hypothetical protein